MWRGKVEVFDIPKHSKAPRCYAWSHRQGHNDADERFVTVLEIPPVKDAHTAVQVAIASEVKNRLK